MHVLRSPWTEESLIGGWAAWRKIRHDFTRKLEHHDRNIASINDPYKQPSGHPAYHKLNKTDDDQVKVLARKYWDKIVGAPA